MKIALHTHADGSRRYRFTCSGFSITRERGPRPTALIIEGVSRVIEKIKEVWPDDQFRAGISLD